mgnify:CR=1 FL=1
MSGTSKIKDLLSDAEKLAPSGFAFAFHIRMTTPDFLFQTYPKAWIDTYSEKGYVMVDPIVRWGFTEIGHIRWSSLSEMDDQNILEQSRAYGMNFGVAIATETGNSRSFAGFARPDREYDDAETSKLIGYVQSLHDLTASKNGMEADLRDELQRLSIEMTHPSTT